MVTESIAIIGCGNMGNSLLGGLIKDNYPPEKLWIADTDIHKLKHVEHEFGIQTTNDNVKVVQTAKVVILAIKPQSFAGIATEIAPIVQEHKPLVISIAAGVRIDSIQKWLGGNIPIVRTMPNTPALIGCGATALFANAFVSERQHNLAESILRAVGLIVWLNDEKLMDAVTALSGSGPAYFFALMEAMQTAGEQLGLSTEISRLLTLQTAFGAARMALESQEPVSTLRERVTSKGGTTEAALNVFNNQHFPTIIENALQAAANRSNELADLLAEEN